MITTLAYAIANRIGSRHRWFRVKNSCPQPSRANTGLNPVIFTSGAPKLPPPVASDTSTPAGVPLYQAAIVPLASLV
jgi:hypothetical protein